MLEQKLKAEIKKLSNSQVGQVLSEQLKTYEKKLKTLVDDLNVRGRDARDKSKKQLETLADQLKHSRSDLERKILTTLNKEAKRLNKNFQDLFTYIEKLTEEKSEIRTKSVKSVKKLASKGKVALKKKVNRAINSADSVSNDSRTTLQ